MDAKSEPLTHFSAALHTLSNAANPSQNTVLSVLLARDKIHLIIDSLSTEQSLQLFQLDEQLRNCAPKILAHASLEAWRESLTVESQAWWWHLEAPVHRLDRFDWVWNAGTVTALTAAAGLVLDISSKFLVTNPGVIGSFALVGQTVLTMATAGGVLTDAGRKGIEQAIASVGIRKPLVQETKLGLALLLLTGLVGFRSSLPQLSTYLANVGIKDAEQGELAEARDELQRAVSLDPTNAEAHFHLGQVYAELGQGDLAQEQYQMAVSSGNYPAVVALADWYLDNGESSRAAALINRALSDIPETDENRELRSQLYTQLGQARLAQTRYNEAQTSLETAIALSQASSTTNTSASPNASAYCLLGQTLDLNNQSDTAVEAWQQCLTYGDNQNSDEDTWMGVADQRIRQFRQTRPEMPQSTEPQSQNQKTVTPGSIPPAIVNPSYP